MNNESGPSPQDGTSSEGALVAARTDDAHLTLQEIFHLWAKSTTEAGTAPREDMIRDKQRAVAHFFAYTGKVPGEVSPLDVRDWQSELETKGLRPGTIYVRVSLLSSFYNWAMRYPVLYGSVQSNPVTLARPRAPKAYQTDSVKSFTDKELIALVEHVRGRAGTAVWSPSVITPCCDSMLLRAGGARRLSLYAGRTSVSQTG
jgi:hypothetical protein